MPTLESLLALLTGNNGNSLNLPSLPKIPKGLIPDGPVAPAMPSSDPSWYREDGSPKGNGFLGALKRPDGGVMSEYSIADSEKIKDKQGHYLDYPSLVPTLDDAEVQQILNSQPGQPLSQSIKDKAEAYALSRIKSNKPVFASTGERPYRSGVKLKQK